jgi:hypothetical protein
MGTFSEQDRDGRHLEKGAWAQGWMLSARQLSRQEAQTLEHLPHRQSGHRHLVQLVPDIGARGPDEASVTQPIVWVRYNVVEIHVVTSRQRMLRVMNGR